MYSHFVRFLNPYKKKIFFIFFCIFMYTIFNAVSISLIQPLFDYVLAPKEINYQTKDVIESRENINSSDSIYYKIITIKNTLKKNIKTKLAGYSKTKLFIILIVLIIISVLLKALFHIIYTYYSSVITQEFIKDLRNSLYKHLQILPLSYFRQRKTGSIISHITNDVLLLDDFVSQGIVSLALNGMSVIFFIFILFYLHWKLAFFSIFVLIFTVLPIKITSKKLYKFSKRFQEKTEEITGIINESLSGVKMIKSYCGEKIEQDKFNKINDSIARNLIRSMRINAILIPMVELMATIGFILVILYGGKEILTNKLSGGQFVLFLGAFFSLGNPLKKLSQVIEYLNQGTAAMDRVISILEIPDLQMKRNSKENFIDLKKEINFKDICFKYGTDTYALKNINLNVKKGEVVAFAGESGAGKSTLLDMLPCFLEPESGKVEFDGIDIADFNIKSLRDKIGIVSQEAILFHDSVKNNIAYGRQDASIEEIIHAAKLANAHEFISQLTDGYDTIIGERGSKLSGGQRQRICIARAILKNPPILILDEATSNIDIQSEKLVQEALYNLMKDKTTFIIAHRFSSIKLAHRVILMEKGTITAIGTHEELMGKSNFYRGLSNPVDYIR